MVVDIRFLDPLGLDVPSTKVISRDFQEPLLLVFDVADSTCQPRSVLVTYPKIRSGCEKKSVILSNKDRGSRTNVGSAILLKSIPGRTAQHQPAVSRVPVDKAHIER